MSKVLAVDLKISEQLLGLLLSVLLLGAIKGGLFR